MPNLNIEKFIMQFNHIHHLYYGHAIPVYEVTDEVTDEILKRIVTYLNWEYYPILNKNIYHFQINVENSVRYPSSPVTIVLYWNWSQNKTYAKQFLKHLASITDDLMHMMIRYEYIYLPPNDIEYKKTIGEEPFYKLVHL